MGAVFWTVAALISGIWLYIVIHEIRALLQPAPAERKENQ